MGVSLILDCPAGWCWWEVKGPVVIDFGDVMGTWGVWALGVGVGD